MRYNSEVAMLTRTGWQRGSRYLFGLSLCVLLIFFAVAAKVSLYYPDQANRPISATKIWQGSSQATVAEANPLPAPSLLWMFVLTLATVPVLVAWSSTVEQSIALPRRLISPQLSVRPPPSR